MDGGSAGVTGVFTCLTGDHFPGKRAGVDTLRFFLWQPRKNLKCHHQHQNTG
jgi:hypothetical protein